MMFHALYQMQTLAPVTVAGGTVWAQAAMQGKRGTLVLANPTGEDAALSLDLRGFPSLMRSCCASMMRTDTP